jgi:hypothetical protein
VYDITQLTLSPKKALVFFRLLIGPNDLEVIHRDKDVILPFFAECSSIEFATSAVCFNTQCLSYLHQNKDKVFYEDLYGKKYCSLQCLPQITRKKYTFQERKLLAVEDVNAFSAAADDDYVDELYSLPTLPIPSEPADVEEFLQNIFSDNDLTRL